jgi:hypothetical protein
MSSAYVADDDLTDELEAGERSPLQSLSAVDSPGLEPASDKEREALLGERSVQTGKPIGQRQQSSALLSTVVTSC